ncbi:hypothetical protein F7725_002183 [Dissostichus mawsoni]|uniref:G-protein coupled receptors family 1 profile domain-containing protein n=1 Tax=Dissostichus mawsoni TaxID=36200 RepID=A0A7J5Y1N5_DISMA|nr:hypothetical protein F7725_002183 [Dissostichus mawsoni]
MAVGNITLNSAENSPNESSCDVFIYQRAAVVLFPIFYSVVFIVSACGNSLVLYMICQRKQKFNSTSIYLVNLALSDTLFTLALPGRIIYYIRHFDWPFGDLLCRLTTLLFFTNTYAGIGFMTCISLDRYLAMVHPQRLPCLRSVKVVRRVSCLVWALVFLEVAPLMFRSMLREHQGRQTCMEYFNFEGSRFTPYFLILACTISFCCPLIIIMACYAKINLKLRAAAKHNSVTSRSKRNHRANTIILLILLTFIICFSPYHLNVMQFMSRKIHHQATCEELRAFKVSLQITVSLMNFNCCLDPIIYFFAIKTYKSDHGGAWCVLSVSDGVHSRLMPVTGSLNIKMGSTASPVIFTVSTTNNDSNKTTCNTLYAHRDYARVLMPLFYFIVFVVGLLGNCLALHVIRPNLKKINSTTLYSLNLVVSDILFTLSLPLRIIYYAMGFHWPLGEALCKISGIIFYINTYAGVNFMTCLSVDRFIAVVLPLRFARLRKVSNVRYICVGVWLLVLAQTLPLVAMPMTNKEPEGFITCMEYPNFEKVDHIATILLGAVFLGYVLPVSTILICYSVLCSKLHFSAKSNHLTGKSGRSQKAIGVICCVSIVFIICYSPYHIDILQYMIRKLVSSPDCADLTAFQISLHITVV